MPGLSEGRGPIEGGGVEAFASGEAVAVDVERLARDGVRTGDIGQAEAEGVAAGDDRDRGGGAETHD